MYDTSQEALYSPSKNIQRRRRRMRKNLTLLMRGPKIYDVVEAGMGGKEKKIRRL
jgi:hypothetical protein